MNRGTNIALLIVAAVAAMATDRLLFARPEFVDRPVATAASLEGEVISSDPASAGRPGHALVKLRTGERVHAVVPYGCSVLPGQITRLKKEIGSSSYIVVENGRVGG